MRFIAGGRDSLQCILKIARGKFVLRVVGGNGDENLVGQRSGLPEICLTRSGKQGWPRLRHAQSGTGKKRGEGDARQSG